MNVTLNDALNLIQVAEKEMKNNTDSSFVEVLTSLVVWLKQQLSQDLGLPMDFFEPVAAGEPIEQVPIELEAETKAPENPELSPKAQKIYDDINIGLNTFL